MCLSYYVQLILVIKVNRDEGRRVYLFFPPHGRFSIIKDRPSVEREENYNPSLMKEKSFTGCGALLKFIRLSNTCIIHHSLKQMMQLCWSQVVKELPEVNKLPQPESDFMC